jgi:hypothetical protein
MGYCISMDISNLHIPLENVSKALKAINALHKDQATIVKNGGGGSSSGGGKPTVHFYSWVDNPPEGGFKSLEEAFEAWRYSASNQDGNCVIECFNGEKLGDCETLWRALEKLVSPTGKIHCRGEDGMEWKWVFKGGKFKEVTSTRVWEDEG